MAKQICKKLDLACEQLDVALDLFLTRKSYVSALTLAGAAEEILGKLLFVEGKQNVLERWCELTTPVSKLFFAGEYSVSVYVKEKNQIRNSVKHLRDGADVEFSADIEEEALLMLVRACDNYIRLGLPATVKMQELNAWFEENIVGTIG